MRFVAALPLFSLLALFTPVATWADETPALEHSNAAAPTEWHRGACYAHVWRPGRGYGSDVGQQSLNRLASLHANWISITPFGWAPDDTTAVVRGIHDAPAGMRPMAETDDKLIATTERAHALGMKVMLKPHIWITPRAGSWRGSIHFDDPEQWDVWFAEYATFILRYAALAEESGMDAFCIGTELVTATQARPSAWRELIRQVREIYSGPITYAAHYYDEAERIPFWDALDWIGVNAYFPLTKVDRPSVEQLVAAWAPHAAALEELSHRWERPVIFTELGYRATTDAAAEPGLWHTKAPLSPMTQARAYEAVFKTFIDEPWFRGVYWWKWESDDERYGGIEDADFTPQHKPAEFVIRTYYRRLSSSDSPALDTQQDS